MKFIGIHIITLVFVLSGCLWSCDGQRSSQCACDNIDFAYPVDYHRFSDSADRSLTSLYIMGVVDTLPMSLLEFPNLCKLDIIDGDLRNFPSTIPLLPQLSSLVVVACKLDHLPPDFASQCLMDLSLDYNEISSVQISSDQFPVLAYLNINYNKLNKLRFIGDDFHSLRGISFAGNDLQEIPEAVVRMRDLERMDFAFNQIASLPENFHRLTKLSYLNLRGNCIQNFRELEGLENLRDLSLGGLHVSIDLQSVGRFYYPNLIRLDLQGTNNVMALFAKGISLPSLENLSLSGCDLDSIPSFVYDLKNLKSLDLSNNRIRSVDQRIVALRNLEVLYLSDNLLEELPATIHELDKLKEISLYGNPMYGELKD